MKQLFFCLSRGPLYYFNARYYDATIGRFINVDPIQDGTNWYMYCSNNPLSFLDPTGLDDYALMEQQGYANTQGDQIENNQTISDTNSLSENQQVENELNNFFDDTKTPRTSYIGASVTASNPIAVAKGVFNKLTGKDEQVVDSANASGGLYFHTMSYDAETDKFTFLEIGLYGTIGVGGGTPDYSLGLEGGESHKTPETILSGESLEIGGGGTYGVLSYQGSAILNSKTNEVIGKEGSVSLGLGLPFDFHADLEKSGHVPLFKLSN